MHVPGDDLTQARIRFTDEAVARADIVLDLLDELRAARYAPSGWARFGLRSWRTAQCTAGKHPRLTRSWRRVAIGLALAEVVVLAAEARLGGDDGRAARRAAPGVVLCLAYTLADVYVHLGMNHETRGVLLHDTLGFPTILTLSRSAVAGMLLGHLIGRVPIQRDVISLTLVTASITDVADGYLARKMGCTTRLGAYLDSEADFGVGMAMTLTLLARRDLPRWLAAGMLARWIMPFAFALISYFGQGKRVPISSTLAGKASGVAQTMTLGLALLPARRQQGFPELQRALHVTTLMLLIVAPLVQLMKRR